MWREMAEAYFKSSCQYQSQVNHRHNEMHSYADVTPPDISNYDTQLTMKPYLNI
jgi:hypothetical protein